MAPAIPRVRTQTLGSSLWLIGSGFASYPFARMLLQIKVPVMDGWELRDAQLADPALADMPALRLTGMLYPREVEEKLGIPCLRKPLDSPFVIRAVENACG